MDADATNAHAASEAPGRPPRLETPVIERALSTLPGWSLADGRLHKAYRFADFAGAMRFMSAAAGEAERLDHHPDWSNSYRTVTVDLSTHSARGITDLDLRLAAAMEALASEA